MVALSFPIEMNEDKMAKKAARKSTTTKSAGSGKPKGLDLIRKITLSAKNKKIDDFGPGDTVNVYVKVKEGEKERLQLYKGTVTKIQNSGAGRSFTVRKISAGVGVERTFPFSSPIVDRVEVLTHGKVRRAKLYYLRDREGKSAKIESELVGQSGEVAAEEAVAE